MNKNVTIYYINLDRSTKRNEALIKNLADFDCDIHRISAIDGRQLDYTKVPDYMYDYREKYYQHLSLGEIACTLSHKKVLNEFLKSDYDYAIVLEDDAVVTEELKIIMQNLEEIKGWDIIKLENRKHTQRDFKYEVKTIEMLSIYVPKNLTFAALAIAYTKEGARKVLNMNDKIYYAFDTQFVLSKEYQLKYLSVTPNLVLPSEIESDIGGGRARLKDKNIFKAYRRRIIRLYRSLEKVAYQKELYTYFKQIN